MQRINVQSREVCNLTGFTVHIIFNNIPDMHLYAFICIYAFMHLCFYALIQSLVMIIFKIITQYHMEERACLAEN